MLCEYRYELKFPLRLPQSIPVWVSDFRFEFETSNELLVAVKFAVACNDPELWPRIKIHPGTNRNEITFPSPRDVEVNEITLTFFALLSLRGWKAEWNKTYPTRTWIPESEVEAVGLVANELKLSRSRRHCPTDSPIPINDLLQTALASDQARVLRQPFEFLQYADERYGARRFIEAFQYYYLAIESLYCNGATKEASVVARFMSTPSLCDGIRKAIDSPELYVDKDEDRERYREFVADLSTEKAAFTKLVRQRGQLHHHNMRLSDVWSVNGQERYWGIATLAANLVMPQLFWESKKYVWSEAVLRQYEQLRAN